MKGKGFVIVQLQKIIFVVFVVLLDHFRFLSCLQLLLLLGGLPLALFAENGFVSLITLLKLYVDLPGLLSRPLFI